MSEQDAPPSPVRDAAAVNRVARVVDIANVELVGSHYEREDDGFETLELPNVEPVIRVGLEWEVEHPRLIVIPTFATDFEEEPQPYSIVARFRLTYLVDDDAPPDQADVEQFAHWNAIFNAWPYWREFVSSTINRGQLPRFVVPVMRAPLSVPPDQ